MVTGLVTVDGNRMAAKRRRFLAQCEHRVYLTRRGPTKIEPWEGMEPLKIQAVRFVGGLASLQFIGDGLLLENLRSYIVTLS